MLLDELREHCLAKADTTESLPFGPDVLVFKVLNKVFLLAALDTVPLQFNVKCPPDQALEWREAYPEAVLPGYHMNKKHWNTVLVNGQVSRKSLLEMIDLSYQLVRGKK